MERNVFTPDQEKWLAALESGEYRQTVGSLEKGGAFCCLGVAEHLGLAKGDEYGEMDLSDDNRLHLRDGAGGFRRIGDSADSLIVLNDSAAWPFDKIAAFIRANPWQVFTNFDVPTPEASR